jgi:hypothetical protein
MSKTRSRPYQGKGSKSRLARGQPRTKDPNHDLPEATLGRKTQSQLARGHHRAGVTITAHPRPTLDGRRICDSPDASLGRDAHFRCARGRIRRRSGSYPLQPTTSIPECVFVRSPASLRCQSQQRKTRVRSNLLLPPTMMHMVRIPDIVPPLRPLFQPLQAHM